MVLKSSIEKVRWTTLQWSRSTVTYSQAQRDYLPEMVHRLLPENHEHPERRRPAFTPEKVLANLRRLRLRSSVRVRDIQDLTRHQRDGKLTVAEFRSLLREVVCSVLPRWCFSWWFVCVCVFWIVLEGSLHCSSKIFNIYLSLYRARDKIKGYQQHEPARVLSSLQYLIFIYIYIYLY